MSSRHKGKGRGGKNPLATPFEIRTHRQTPDSPEDTRMEENPASPVQAVPAPPSSTTSTREPSPFPATTPKFISEEIKDTNLGTRIRLSNLEEAFQAIQAHLMVVQNRHIDDIQSLEDQVATLTSQVAQLREQLLQYQTQPQHHPQPPQQLPLTWAQKAAKLTAPKPSTTPAKKEASPPVLTKRDRTIVIERDGSPLPDDITPLTIRNSFNTAIKKPLIATIEFTTNHHVHLITKDNITASAVLKHNRQAIEETARSTVPAATGLRQDEIWHKVIIHGIPTTIPSTPDGFNTIKSEIEEFNPGTHLPRLPRWLTTTTQRASKTASTMVITIAGKDSTEKALSRGLSLFGRKFKVQRYLNFGPDTQCSRCLAFGHHPSHCTGTIHCAICSEEHPTYQHSCGRSDCLTRGKACIHTTIKCNNCDEPHPATSKECETYLAANQVATERRNRAI